MVNILSQIRTSSSLLFSISVSHSLFILVYLYQNTQQSEIKKNLYDILFRAMKEITSTQQFHEVFVNSSAETIAALFWAEWAEGSNANLETLAALSEEYEDQVEFVSLDAQKNADLSKHFVIKQLPSLLFFSKKDKTLQKITRNLKKSNF